MTQHVTDVNQLEAVARALLAEAGTRRVWLFFGEMGAGKTTLIKALCRALGVATVVQSPTFGLVNEYATLAADPIYHLDCYRLKSEAEALDIGLETYLDSGAYCFVEWPERIETLWPPACYRVTLLPDETGSRTITTACC